jgi:hypothetical protein
LQIGSLFGGHFGMHTGSESGAHLGGHGSDRGAHFGGLFGSQTGSQTVLRTGSSQELELLPEQPVQRSAEAPKKTNEANIPSCFFIKRLL